MNIKILIKKILFVLCISLAVTQLFSESLKIEYLLPEEYERTKEDLEIIFIDVGQGDCALINTPNKKNILIDAGGTPEWMDTGFDPGEEIVVPYLLDHNIKKIDFVIVSHPHGDHFGGMFAVLNSLQVSEFIDNGYPHGDPGYEDLLELVDTREILYQQFNEGERLELDNEIAIIVFYPPKKSFPFEGANNSSIVCKLIYRNFSVLFTGDIEIEAEHYICSKYKKQLKSTVLKVPHHGSRTSSSSQFIKYVSPEVAIIQCGRKNLFGHPHNEVISRYQRNKVDIYRTDKDGTVKILSDGYKYTVITMSD